MSVAVSGSPTPSVTGRRGDPRGVATAAAFAAASSASACSRSSGSVPAVAASSCAAAASFSLTRFCACCQQSACSSGSRVSSHGLPDCASTSGWLTIFRIRSSCHRQMPATTTKLSTQMMIRVRSSSRCSTIDSRSSCAIGLSFVAMVLLRAERSGR